MITTIRTYRNLRTKGMRHAWEISGMPEVGDKLVGILCWIIGIVGVLYLLSDYANAAQAARDGDNAAYVHALEKTLAACLGDTEGAVFIGGELHLCRAVPTGIRQ